MRTHDLRFEPSHELTFDTVHSDRARLLQSLQQGGLLCVSFDLSRVVHCDSAGLALLIEAKRLCRQYHTLFIIEAMSKEVHALAEFCGIDDILCARVV